MEKKFNLKNLEWVGFWIGLFGFFIAGVTFTLSVINSQNSNENSTELIEEESSIMRLHSECWEIEVDGDGDTVLLIPKY